jgi:hypothetical protein
MTWIAARSKPSLPFSERQRPARDRDAMREEERMDESRRANPEHPPIHPPATD